MRILMSVLLSLLFMSPSFAQDKTTPPLKNFEELRTVLETGLAKTLKGEDHDKAFDKFQLNPRVRNQAKAIKKLQEATKRAGVKSYQLLGVDLTIAFTTKDQVVTRLKGSLSFLKEGCLFTPDQVATKPSKISRLLDLEQCKDSYPFITKGVKDLINRLREAKHWKQAPFMTTKEQLRGFLPLSVPEEAMQKIWQGMQDEAEKTYAVASKVEYTSLHISLGRAYFKALDADKKWKGTVTIHFSVEVGKKVIYWALRGYQPLP